METIDLNAAYVTLINEGAELFAKGKYEAALSSFWKAFRLQPSAPKILFNIGRTMEELKDPRCEDFYAAAGSQGSVDAFYQLALLYIANDRIEVAVASLKAYLKGTEEEDECTRWARETIRSLCPTELSIIWKNPKKNRKSRKKLVKNPIQKQVRFRIL